MMWRRLLSESSEQVQQSGLPRSVVRYLAGSCGAGIGSRVLVAGCGSGELVRCLSHFGFRAAGLDESPELIAAAQRESPDIEYYCRQPVFDNPCAEAAYDLVIVQSMDVLRESLLSRPALRTTASLLSCLRPGKRLAILANRHPSADQPAHGACCYERQLALLAGGVVRVEEFQAGVAGDTPPCAVEQRSLAAGWFVVSLRAPAAAGGREEWLRAADRVAGGMAGVSCCEAAQRPAEFDERRAAA